MKAPEIAHDPDFLIGVDLGQARDWTAIIIAQRHEELTGVYAQKRKTWETETRYEVRHIERPPLGTSYPEIAGRIRTLSDRLPRPNRTSLVVDNTGVGRPVVDMMREAGLQPVPITITGGLNETWLKGAATTPKRVLVSNMSLLFASGRLKISRRLPEADVLQRELENFKMKISVSGNDSYEAWREGDHDDLVLATAMACWWGERLPSILSIPRLPPPPIQTRGLTFDEAFKEHRRRLAQRKDERRWA